TSTPMPSPGMTAIRIRAPPRPSAAAQAVEDTNARSQIRRVDLRALELAAEVDVNRFPFRKDVERRSPCFAMAVAGRFGAAKRKVHLRADRRRVDVEDSGVHVAHRRERTIHVLCID